MPDAPRQTGWKAARLGRQSLPVSNTPGSVFAHTLEMTRRHNPARILRAFAFSTEGEHASTRNFLRCAGRAQRTECEPIKWDGIRHFLPEPACHSTVNVRVMGLRRTSVR